MSTELLQQIAAAQGPHLVPLTVDQYHRMLEARIIQEGAPIELIDGLLVHKDRSATGADPLTHNPRHSLIVTRLQRLLDRWAEKIGHHIRSQIPLDLSEVDCPEPDITLVSGPPERYSERHPGPADVFLVVEVADSSLGFDRTTKQRLYSEAGLPEFWIVNVRSNVIEVFKQPDHTTLKYLVHEEFRAGQHITYRLGEHSLEVDVAALLS